MRNLALMCRRGPDARTGRRGVDRRHAAGSRAEHSQIENAQLRCGVQPVLVHCREPNSEPNSPFALGDELTFHDMLKDLGKQVGDDLGSCVITELSPVLANCTEVIRLPGGNITAQFANAPPKRSWR